MANICTLDEIRPSPVNDASDGAGVRVNEDVITIEVAVSKMESLRFVGGRRDSWSVESRYDIIDFEGHFKSLVFRFRPFPCRGLSKESKSLHPFAATFIRRKLFGVTKKGDIVNRTDR
jgi:hypothetical protein